MDTVNDVSQLIIDMVYKGTTNDDMARVIRYSMDVMEVEKSIANVEQSYINNGISELKEKYQGN